MKRLVLFDVDGTLIARGDPDHLAAIDAGLLASFPNVKVSVKDIDFDGKVDRQIMRELLRLAEIDREVDLALLLTILESSAADYRRSWERRSGGDADLLPGVRVLIERLAQDDRFALGLLTGGIRGIVEAKLERLGLEHYFPIGAFGDEVDARADLLPLALTRAFDHYSVRFETQGVVVVGDTPHDIAAAHAGGAACVAVATGRFSQSELRATGADAVLADLSVTSSVVATLSALELMSTQD
jgi:phosphoglycolate phosphatase